MTRFHPSPLLRRALAADAAASFATALLLLAGAGALAPVLHLPEPLLRGAGLILLPFAGLVAWLAARPVLARPMVQAVIAVNVLWVLDSIVLLLSGWVQPSALGVGFVLAQAAAVGVLAELQIIGLKRAPELA